MICIQPALTLIIFLACILYDGYPGAYRATSSRSWILRQVASVLASSVSLRRPLREHFGRLSLDVQVWVPDSTRHQFCPCGALRTQPPPDQSITPHHTLGKSVHLSVRFNHFFDVAYQERIRTTLLDKISNCFLD